MVVVAYAIASELVIVACAATSVVVVVVVVFALFWGGWGFSLYGLPESSLLLCRDGPQAPALTYLVRLLRSLLLLLRSR